MTARVARIGDIVSVRGGGTPTRTNEEYYGGSYPWVTPKDMKPWLIHGSQVTLTEAGVASSPAKVIPSNSVLLVVRSGVLKHSVPVALNRVPVTLNQDMKALVCGDEILPDYLARYISEKSPEILTWVRATTADNYSIDKLRDMRIPLPSIERQAEVVAVLDRVDELRAKRRQSIALLDDLAQSIFLDMFGSNRPTVELGSHLSFITSGGRGWARYYAETGSRFIRSLDVQMNHIDDFYPVRVDAPDNAEATRTRVAEGDVLLTITGSQIGRVAPTMREHEGSYVSQHVAILRPIRDRILPRYLAYYLSLPSGGQRQISAMQYGQTKPGLNFRQIREFEIPVAAMSEQAEFVQSLEDISRMAAAQQTHLDRLDDLFSSLQSRAFAGDLWKDDPKDQEGE